MTSKEEPYQFHCFDNIRHSQAISVTSSHILGRRCLCSRLILEISNPQQRGGARKKLTMG